MLFTRSHARLSAALAVVALSALPAHAGFHLWSLNEIFTNSSGTLQFIELRTTSGTENFVGGMQISVTNVANTITNTFTLPGGSLAGSTANKNLLFGTAGLQAAGGPTPDYIIPNNFLFSAGGFISFFGNNSGSYTALPTDGTNSRTWGGGNAVNTPRNYAGQTGTVPEPLIVPLLAFGGMLAARRRRA